MDYIDYYKILGIDKSASDDDIKKAYRKLARKLHPDLNPNNTDAVKRFQELNEANEVLSNPENRKKYDQYGANWQHAEQFEQARRQQETSGQNARRPFSEAGEQYSFSGDEGDYSDFFASMFGNRGGGRQAHFKGQDYRATVELKLSEAYHTHQQTFNVNGKNIRIKVAAGISDGQEIKVPGHGAPGANSGPAGDLYITFNIINDTAFLRRGDDLYVDKALDLYKAILGGEETIETMNGKLKLKVVPETQNGAKVRVKGKGFPKYKEEDAYGDLYVTFQIKLPTKLSDKEKELFNELARERESK